MAMLIRPAPLELDPDHPFRFDKLGREESATLLTSLVERAQAPFVLAIDSKWGNGKTTFIQMWKAHLVKNGFCCLYFNAWQTDFVIDPLVSIIAEIDSQIEWELIPPEYRNKAQKYFDRAVKAAGTLVRQAAPAAVSIAGISLAGTGPGGTLLTGAAQNIAKKKVKEYETEKKALKSFKERLSKSIALIRSSGSTKGKSIVFFIDELDRCRPSFAIELLERVKHVFDIEGIVFVLAIDRVQLGHSIGAIYGAGLDADGYLRRFIDLHYRLPDPPRDLFPVFLFNQFKIPDLLKQLNPQVSLTTHRLTIDWFSGLAEIFELSLRKQEQIFSELSLMIAMGTRDDAEDCPLIAALLALRAHREELYANVIVGHITVEKLLEYIKSKAHGEAFLNSDSGTELEAWFLGMFRDVFKDSTAKQIEQKYKEMESNNDTPEPVKRRASTICYMLRAWKFPHQMVSRIKKRIAISGRFAT